MLLRFFSSFRTPFLPPCLRRPEAQLPYSFHAYRNANRRRKTSSVHAVEKESQFEIDREKAKEALQKLDEQLQTLSQTPESPTKNRRLSSSQPPHFDPNFERELMTGLRPEKEMPALSGSYLAYSAFFLLFLTFFFNIVFYTYIKPSVDGNEPVATTLRREPMNPETTKVAPPISDQD